MSGARERVLPACVDGLEICGCSSSETAGNIVLKVWVFAVAVPFQPYFRVDLRSLLNIRWKLTWRGHISTLSLACNRKARRLEETIYLYQVYQRHAATCQSVMPCGEDAHHQSWQKPLNAASPRTVTTGKLHASPTTLQLTVGPASVPVGG